MVYRISPYAELVNHAVWFDYEEPPGPSWYDYFMNEQPVPKERAPTLLLSKKKGPLPPAFQIAAEIWCVSAELRDLMQRLYGSQVAFYEVPVVVKADRRPLPPTYFVAFSQFRHLIDWTRSKTTTYTRSYAGNSVETVTLADVPKAAVFEAMPKDRPMIWIETSFLADGRHFSPPGAYSVYTTNAAGRTMAEAFPNCFVIREFEESQAS